MMLVCVLDPTWNISAILFVVIGDFCVAVPLIDFDLLPSVFNITRI